MSTNSETIAGAYATPIDERAGSSTGAVTAASNRSFLIALAAFMVLVASTLLYPDTFISDGPHLAGFRISPMKIMLVLTAPPIAWYMIRNRARVRFRSFDLVFMLAMAFVAIRGVLGAENATVAGLDLAWVGYALTLYYGSAYLTRTDLARRAITWMFVVLGIGIGLYAIVEFFTGSNIYWDLTQELVGEQANLHHRSVSTVGNPLVLGLFAAQVAPLVFYMFSRTQKKSAEIVLLAAVTVMALAIEVTLSKGAWISGSLLALTGFIWAVWKWPDARRRVIVVFGCTVAVLGLFTVVNFADLKAQAASEERHRVSIDPRLYMLERFPEAFMQSPLIGFGMREGPFAVARIDPNDDPDVMNPNSLDNIFLTNLVDEGLIGSSLILIITIMLAAQVVRLVRTSGESRALAIAWAFSLAALFIDGLTFDTILYWVNLTLFWVIAGMVRAAVERDATDGGALPGDQGT